MKARVRPSDPGDADALAPQLRAADLAEMRAVTHEPPPRVLADGIARSSPCYTVVGDSGAPLAIFGAIPTREHAGFVWLAGCDELVANPYLFLRHSREWLERLHEHYPVLWSRVDARNIVHVRWLRWSGFRFLRTIDEFGIERRPFHEILREKGAAVARGAHSLPPSWQREPLANPLSRDRRAQPE